MPDPILSVEDLHVSFRTDDGLVRAVRGVSFAVGRGETLGIVGESGSGKSVTNLAMMGLVPMPPGVIEHGSAMFGGKDLLKATEREMRQVRGAKIAMIFQDPMTALNPLMTIQQQLTESTRFHLRLSRKEAKRRAVEMLDLVGIASPEKRMRDYPHQFSGGMRQRVMIAMALSCEPELLIADEPTTALDVTVQAQILELLSELQKRRGTSVVLITHDLGIVASQCDRVMVMYAGRAVEKASTKDLFASPRHPYTRGLLDSLPRFDASERDGKPTEQLVAIPGQPPDMTAIPIGCSFRPRCPFSVERCVESDPTLSEVSPLRSSACFVDVRSADKHPPLVTLEDPSS